VFLEFFKKRGREMVENEAFVHAAPEQGLLGEVEAFFPVHHMMTNSDTQMHLWGKMENTLPSS
jgi:hypothetical protein